MTLVRQTMLFALLGAEASAGMQLTESYAGLERKVEERTSELKNSLAQQTAISEILRVISFEAPSHLGCLKCGHPIFSAFRFCPSCGVRLAEPSFTARPRMSDRLPVEHLS